MNSQAPKSSSRPTKPQNQTPTRSTSLSSHFAMIELKQRTLTSLSKLSDRDTHHIAVEDLEKIIQNLSADTVPMVLNCLFDATNDPKPAVKKESIRFLGLLCAHHNDSAATHLPKIISHIVKRLKDSDSAVKDACRDAIGVLSGLYLKGEGENGGVGSVVSLFVKPLFEAMSEQNKGVQGGSAMCMAKMVECAGDTHPPLVSFQKMLPRICKYLNNPNFLAKASLLQVVSSLSQVGAIAPQSLEILLQTVQTCLGNTDWATRKAAADTLSILALHSSNLIEDRATSMVKVLDTCRFDKIKPVRDSMLEALQLWKNIAGKENGASDDAKSPSSDGENLVSAEISEKYSKHANDGDSRNETSGKHSSNDSSPTGASTKGGHSLDKAVGILKKKAPALTEKGLNPEFFQRLETRDSDDLPVEVIVPRRCLDSENSQNEREIKPSDTERTKENCQPENGAVLSRQRYFDDLARNAWSEERDNGKDSRTNWMAIQRQLLQLERQQTHLMNMLQDFMGGSHDSMVTLENRVRGLERVVEDMAHELSISSGARGSKYSMGFEKSSNGASSKYNGFPDYTGAKFGRSYDRWTPFGERYTTSHSAGLPVRGRGPSWRSDAYDFPSYGGNTQMGSRRTLGHMDSRSPNSEHESDEIEDRRVWDKGSGPVRLGEGPSARSVWQASKDEATLEAIRVAGEEKGTARSSRVAIPELTAEAMGDDNNVPERDPIWTSWTNAMDALHVGDMDTAYAEVLSTGDDALLVKLMDRTGAVIDHLTDEVASEVLHAVTQFLEDQDLFDNCLYWIQQLADILGDNGPDALNIPSEVKMELLLNLNEACNTFEPSEDWEGAAPDQLLLQLASLWEIDPLQLVKGS